MGHLKEEDFWKTFYNDYNVIDIDNKYFSTTDEEDDKVAIEQSGSLDKKEDTEVENHES